MKEKIIQRLDALVAEAKELHEVAVQLDTHMGAIINAHLDESIFIAFKTSVLSFLSNTIGQENEYYAAIAGRTKRLGTAETTLLLQLLQKIRRDIEDGWLDNLRGIVSAEIFSDFLAMAGHLFEEGYKDPAAVLIGSVLENNLKVLSGKHNLPTTQPDVKTGEPKPIKADGLNASLAKAQIYNTLMQKSVTAWLDLRNRAAHGHYQEYDAAQVQLMLEGVTDFGGRYL